MRKTILVAAALSATLSVMPAAAQTASRAVGYAGLDLNGARGRAQLNHRIAAAVETVCGSYASASSTETREIDRCRAAARTGIETQLAALRRRDSRLALSSR